MSKNDLKFFDFFYMFSCKKLARNFKKRNRIMGECTEYMKNKILTLHDKGLVEQKKLWNAGLFINLVAHDLSIIVSDVSVERDEWRRLYLARALALILYETAEDIPAVLGKEFQQSMEILSVPKKLKEKLNSEKNNISKFWNENREMLKEIRVSVAAHRDHDSIKQLKIIDEIDIFDIQSLGIKLGTLLNKLGQATQAILTYK